MIFIKSHGSRYHSWLHSFKFKCVIPQGKSDEVYLNIRGQKVETSTAEIYD